MRHLIIMRHAKAERGEGKADYDRELEPRGVADADAVGKALALRGLVPETILCSASRRTRDTLSAMLPHFGNDCDVRLRTALYDAEVVDLRDAMRKAEGDCVLLIGHNPAVHRFSQTLAGGEEPSLAYGFATASAAIFTVGFAIDTTRFVALVTPTSP